MRKPTNLEIRTINENINSENRIVKGYAIVFNSLSVDLGFNEVVLPSAIDIETIKRSDVFALLDHNRERGVLARRKFDNGTLELTIDEKGLFYSFEAPKTALGDELLEAIERGDLTGSSFAFTVEKDSIEYENEKTVRKIKKINRIYDISPVYTPAYEATTATRNIENFNKELNEKILKEKRDQEFKKYISNLRKKIR